MSLVPTRDLIARAYAEHRGVAAFNVITLEHAEAIVRGAEQAGGEVILQISQNAVAFHRAARPLVAACQALAASCSVPASLHLDHVDDTTLLHQAAELGFSSVMFDGSSLAHHDNIAVTAAASSWAHSNGLFVEAELGEIGGKDGAHAPGARTDPLDAASYVADTAVDALAVAVGSSHAMTTRDAHVDLDLITALRKAVDVPLVLHGSSGVPSAELRASVAAGMTKINVGTLLNVAFSSSIAGAAALGLPTDPRRYLRPARDAMTAAVARLMTELAEHDAVSGCR
ncbi:MAG: class II fructose-bisphosphate aldolase [Sciscionella sp.]